MALTRREVAAIQRNTMDLPVKNIICLGKAALKFWLCWQSSQSDQCIKTFIADVEKCLKK